MDSTALSIGENFIFNENGGAVAFWGSTSQTSPIAQLNLAQSFFNKLADETTKTQAGLRLGDVIMHAKQSQGDHSYSVDTIKSWTLFGDPALKIPETAFAEEEQGNPTVEVTPPAAAAPSGGGGGCSAFAAQGAPTTPPWMVILMELIFFAIPLSLVFVLRRRRIKS
ncbi:MAG: hypothetical protein HRT44_02585 [Bdellovibrionales bacterium]|nr:hypothetical protein [Bdellovibrionales bacterium]